MTFNNAWGLGIRLVHCMLLSAIWLAGCNDTPSQRATPTSDAAPADTSNSRTEITKPKKKKPPVEQEPDVTNLSPAMTLSTESVAGDYRLKGMIEMGSGILLQPDGAYKFYLTYGSLDEFDSGTWCLDGSSVVLKTNTPNIDPTLVFLRSSKDDSVPGIRVLFEGESASTSRVARNSARMLVRADGRRIEIYPTSNSTMESKEQASAVNSIEWQFMGMMRSYKPGKLEPSEPLHNHFVFKATSGNYGSVGFDGTRLLVGNGELTLRQPNLQQALRYVRRKQQVAKAPAEPAPKPQEQQHGIVNGQVQLNGPPPTPILIPLKSGSDQKVVGGNSLLEESLIVNSQNGGIDNVVVMLESASQGSALPELLEGESRSDMAVLQMKMLRFTPRIVIVHPGQELLIRNGDPIGHNVNVHSDHSPLNQLLSARGAKGSSTPYTIHQRDSVSVQLSVTSAIHPWMKAYIVVKNHPYVQVTSAGGNFVIPPTPPGRWKLKLWHERTGDIKSVKVEGKGFTIVNGELMVDVPERGSVAGKILVGPENFPDTAVPPNESN